MRIGIDTFTIRELQLDPFQTLDFIHSRGLQGAQFGVLKTLSKTLDLGELKAIRQYADELGLYTHVSASWCNPCLISSPEERRRDLEEEIRLAAQCGWHELHSSLGAGDERYSHQMPWNEHLSSSAKFIHSLGPVLREHDSRINLETHGDTTTFELVRLVEEVGSDIAGICLDTANVLCHSEDPVAAARRAAPYTHLTHIKDAIAFLIPSGYRRQTLPPGKGALDWKVILPILAEYSPDLPLSIEDHKWLFDYHVFERHWLSLHPDLTREEMARVLQFALCCQERISSGELSDPEEYEKICYLVELEDRIATGRDFLKDIIRQLRLESPNLIQV